jgi:hypothetical protein
MRTLLLCAALIASPVFAGQVYKCKGPKGEVTFTNIKCPDDAPAVAVGHYDAVADDPRQAVAAHEEALRIRGEQEAQYEDALAQQTMNQQITDPNRDREDTLRRSADDAKKFTKYDEDLQRWGARVAGRPPPRYPIAASSDDDGTTRREHRRHEPPPSSNCTGNGGGSVTCFGSDGSISNGQIDPTGHGTMFGSDGSVRQIDAENAQGQNCNMDSNGFCN